MKRLKFHSITTLLAVVYCFTQETSNSVGNFQCPWKPAWIKSDTIFILEDLPLVRSLTKVWFYGHHKPSSVVSLWHLSLVSRMSLKVKKVYNIIINTKSLSNDIIMYQNLFLIYITRFCYIFYLYSQRSTCKLYFVFYLLPIHLPKKTFKSIWTI